MRKVCHNLSGAGRSVLLNRIRDSRRQISMATRPTDNGGDQGTGGQTNWYECGIIICDHVDSRPCEPEFLVIPS